MDFVYLPVDFKNGVNLGYAFVNFRSVEACQRFADDFHHVPTKNKLPGFKSEKVCEVRAAAHQGSTENISRLQRSLVMVKLVRKPEWLPQLFDKEGNAVGFPIPDYLLKERKDLSR